MTRVQQKKSKIPPIPFTLEEVYSLSHYEASDELWNRLKVWKASNNYQFIKSLSNLIIKDYTTRTRKLSKQEQDLKQAYIRWLSIGLDSDKFKALDNVKLRNNLGQAGRSATSNEEEYNDMLTHSGIL